ncbi:MAG: hypothetical protein K2Q18_03090 [Bdellovibrionales bacterium]|nr:hypothetical protein [Bdellovibrionales bacterium]
MSFKLTKMIHGTFLLLYTMSAMAGLSDQDLKYIDDNFKTLKLKKGEELRKWDQFKMYSIQGNSKAIESIYEARKLPLEGLYLSTYKYDLFEIYSKNPDFFIKSSNEYFMNNLYCSAYWLFPATGENSLKEVNAVIKDSTNKVTI